jgi:hypothetical protein
MKLYESIRNRQADFIAQNKAQIVISRITRTASTDGGYTEATTTLDSQDFRIYNKNSRVLNVNEGGYHSERITKLIAKYDADIQKESATYLDTFTYNSIKYKVADVKPILTQGFVVFLECELAEIT